ncbi:MAG TPA: hypothetical protein VHJ20_19240 [Polyangia bacterium]|nr:hypothetical protein [Polyangia bacterium]
MRAVVGLWIALATGGCASLPPCPARGGPVWTEVTSPHFVVRTDLPDAAGEALARRLEEARATMLAVSWPHEPDPAGRTHVVAFRSDRELAAVRHGILGEWIKQPPFRPTLLLAGTSELGEDDSAAAHEIAHDVSHRFLPFQPIWYSEGLATFFEALTYDRATGRARVGVATPGRALYVGRGWSSEAVIRAHQYPPAGRALGIFEVRSWLIFHYLFFNRGPQLAVFADRLRALTPWDVAWDQAFPDLPFAKLDHELDGYASDHLFRTATAQLTIVVGAIAKRPLRLPAHRP